MSQENFHLGDRVEFRHATEDWRIDHFIKAPNGWFARITKQGSGEVDNIWLDHLKHWVTPPTKKRPDYDFIQAPADSGTGMIGYERLRQFKEEGFDDKHDDTPEAEGSLLMAALCYAKEGSTDWSGTQLYEPRTGWPWDRKWWKPRDRITNLVKAGALIAAEIDRLIRKKKREG